MLINQHRRYGGWAALAVGILGLLTILFTILFFAFEAPQAVKDVAQGNTRFYPFGFLSDLLPILASLSAWVVIVVLYRLERKGAPQLSAVAALLGIAGNLGLVVGGTLIIFHDITGAETITVMQQILITLMSSGPLGLWQILVNYRARRDGLLPSRLTGFGILLGAGQMAEFVMLSLFGGWSAAATSSPAVVVSNYPLLIALIIGVGGGLVGYIGAPVWAIWLGRVFLVTKVTQVSASPT
jgi:hypothetical protein